MSYNAKENKLAKKLHKIHLNKKWVIIGMSIILVAVGGFLIYKYIVTPKSQTIAHPISGTSDTYVLTPVDKAAKLAFGGDYTAGQQVLDDELKSSDHNEQVMAYVNKASLAVNYKKYDEALVFAQKAEDMDKSRLTSRLIAQIATVAGDKDKAKEYYQLTIDRYSESDRTSDEQASSYYEDNLKLQDLTR